MNWISTVFTQQACFFLIGRKFPIEFVSGAMAAFALDKRFAFFDPRHRNEKYLKIMVDALVIGLMKTANRTTPGGFVKRLCFGGNAEDKEHG